MADLLPLFPLQLVVYPGEALNLHIFEPRYQQLIRECAAQDKSFGIPAYLKGRVMDVGTEVRLVSIEKEYPGGEMDIRTQGGDLFRILTFHRTAPGKLYAGAEVVPLPQGDPAGDLVLGALILQYTRDLFRLLSVDRTLPDEPEAVRTFNLAHHIGMSMEQEYELLCIAEEKERQRYVLEHLEKLLPRMKEMDAIRQRARMNGHFRNIIPPKF